MEERRSSSDCDDEKSVCENYAQRSHSEEFIHALKSCPTLWDPKDRHYTNTRKRNEELDKLVLIYKNVKPHATRDDVKKKINSLRSNYRKELRKIEDSKRSGGEIYIPKSTTFYLLQFLSKIDKPKFNKINGSSEIKSEEDNDPLVIFSITNDIPPEKIRKSKSLAQQNEKVRKTNSLFSRPSTSSGVDPLALVWSDKLKRLEPTQRLFAEKAINDILFEAQFQNLHKDSVQINSFARYSSPEFIQNDE